MKRHGFAKTAILVIGLVAVPAVAAHAQQGMRVAYVVGQNILNQTPGYSTADSIWQVEVEGFRRDLAQLQSKLDSAAAKFAEQSVMLSSTNRAAEQKKLEAQQNDLDQKQSDLQQRAITRQQELLKPIQDRINAVIEGIRAEGNYAMIFDVSAQGNGILAADKSLDLTQKVVDRLKGGSGTTKQF